MKTLTRNTTQQRSNTMRKITDGYKPVPFLIRIHNYTYYHGFKSLVLAAIVLIGVAVFVTLVAPALGANILNDLLHSR